MPPLRSLTIGALVLGFAGSVLPWAALPATAHGTGKDTAIAPKATWSNYFYPPRVGLTCTESFTTADTSGTETLTVASITSNGAGKEIVINQSGSVHAAGKDEPINASSHYLLTKDGRLESEPSSALLSGQSEHSVGFTIYPTVKKLLAGGTGVSTVHEVLPLPASELSALSPALKANQTSLDISIALRQSGQAVASLTVPMGTYHHVLEIKSKIGSFSVTNAVPSAEKLLAGAFGPTLDKIFEVHHLVRPGRGPDPSKRRRTDHRQPGVHGLGQRSIPPRRHRAGSSERLIGRPRAPGHWSARRCRR